MLQYIIIQVTAFQQNYSIVWCDENLQSVVIDPGGLCGRLKRSSLRPLWRRRREPVVPRSTVWYMSPPPYIESPTVFSWAFFGKSPMVTSTYANCLLIFSLLNLSILGRFWSKPPRFFSLFSATLLSFQEATPNGIKDLPGGGLQVEIGERRRQSTEKLRPESVIYSL